MKTLLRWILRAFALALLLAAAVVGWFDAQNAFFNDLPWVGLVLLVGGLSLIKAERVSAALLLLAGLAWLGSAPAPSEKLDLKVVVIGFDGGTFEVIDKHADMLPNFQKLRADGSRGVLHSMEPMFSPLLWTTMASGRPPDEHGIHGFNVHSNDCQVARFWDIAEDAGMGVGLYKWLVDYPPRSFKHGGFWVPSWLAPDVQTWPAELSAVKQLELSNRLRRKQVAAKDSTAAITKQLILDGVRLSTLARAGVWSLQQRFLHPDTVQTNVEMQQIRGWIDRDVFIGQLYRTRPPLATFTYYATDGLAHLYWDRYEEGGDEVLAAYRQADHILGDIRGVLSPDTRVIVVSDHGFKAMDGSGLAGQFAPLTERLKARISAAGIRGVDVSKVGHKLSVGFADAGQRDQLKAFLAGLSDASGKPFYKIEDIEGSATSEGLTLTDETITAERLAADTVGGEPIKDYVTLTDAYTGTHKYNGILYLAGPGVEPGKDLGEVPMLDVAPTVLAALGIPASVEMKGSPVVFPEAGARVEDYDHLLLNLSWIDGAEGVNDAQLKALGYIQ